MLPYMMAIGTLLLLALTNALLASLRKSNVTLWFFLGIFLGVFGWFIQLALGPNSLKKENYQLALTMPGISPEEANSLKQSRES